MHSDTRPGETDPARRPSPDWIRVRAQAPIRSPTGRKRRRSTVKRGREASSSPRTRSETSCSRLIPTCRSTFVGCPLGSELDVPRLGNRRSPWLDQLTASGADRTFRPCARRRATATECRAVIRSRRRSWSPSLSTVRMLQIAFTLSTPTRLYVADLVRAGTHEGWLTQRLLDAPGRSGGDPGRPGRTLPSWTGKTTRFGTSCRSMSSPSLGVMGHTEIGVTMNVYGHLFDGARGATHKRPRHPAPIDPLPQANDSGRTGSSRSSLGSDAGPQGRQKGGWGVKRACHNGHSRSPTVTRNRCHAGVMRIDQVIWLRVQEGSIPPAPPV